MESSTTQALSASNTTETGTTPADRSTVFRLIVEGVATHGLPIPMATYLHDTRSMVLRFDDNDTDSVERWAAYLSLGTPERNPHMYGLETSRPWKSYTTGSFTPLTGVSGWTANVWCLVTATEAEVAAALVKATAADLVEVTK